MNVDSVAVATAAERETVLITMTTKTEVEGQTDGGVHCTRRRVGTEERVRERGGARRT